MEDTPPHPFFCPLRKGGDVHLDSGSDAESQDSGFSGSFSDKSCTESFTPNTRLSARRTSFIDEDTEDGFTHMLNLDAMDASPNVPDVLTSLFTKPICRSTREEDEKLLKSDLTPVRPGRKKACRRLSMTAETSIHDSPLSGTSSVSKSPLYFSLLKKRIKRHKSCGALNKNTGADQCCKSGDHPGDNENCSRCANSKNHTSDSPIKSPFKRPEPPEQCGPLWSKRQKRSPLSYSVKLQLASIKRPVLQRSFSESEATIMKALQKSDEQPDLIGDFSKPYILPLINGRHQDMKTVTPDTLAQLMKGVYKSTVLSYKVVDCRYPYEFKGGHIKGALNIFTRDGIVSGLLSQTLQHDKEKRSIVIFHCEFSSERAPNLCRFLRNQDRECNKDSYPQLCHPEVYLLEGGYKAFFASFKELCEPQTYTPMLHKDYEVELRHFRAKSKSWSGGHQNKRANVRMGRKFQIV